MFDDAAFSSWPRILTGALVFAFAFELLLILGDYVIGGSLALTRTTLVVAGVAFVGYLVTASLIKRTGNSSDS